jgi:RNA polymerase sigma factor (sigma-70 family)
MFEDNALLGLLNDRSLHALIRSESDAERMREIGRIIVHDARVVVERVFAHYRRMLSGVYDSDLEDVAATVALRLARKLQRVPGSVDEAIRDFDLYVARTTSNAVHDLLRVRFPFRARLERRLRHLLKWDRRLASWETSDGVLCGLAEWEHSSRFSRSISVPAGPSPVAANDLVAIFRASGEPVPFELLAAAIAEARGITDEIPNETFAPVDDEPEQSSAFATKELVESLWREIQELPPRQRSALLLNLRDTERENALSLFPLMGVASFSEIALALMMSPEDLAALWNDLPLEDLKIAALLGVTRQQVINLRMSARKRLQRRLFRREERF